MTLQSRLTRLERDAIAQAHTEMESALDVLMTLLVETTNDAERDAMQRFFELAPDRIPADVLDVAGQVFERIPADVQVRAIEAGDRYAALAGLERLT